MTRDGKQNGLWAAPDVATAFDADAEIVIMAGDSAEKLREVPSGTAKLIITSPPYNLGKEYETATDLGRYLEALDPIVRELVRLLSPMGSLCWQVGNYVVDGEIFPVDIYYYPFFKKHGLMLRTRIICHFAHGLHAS